MFKLFKMLGFTMHKFTFAIIVCLLTAKIHGVCSLSNFNELGDAIDTKNVSKVEKLAQVVTLSQKQKDELVGMTKNWVEYYESKAKGFWRNGADQIKFWPGIVLSLAGLAALALPKTFSFIKNRGESEMAKGVKNGCYIAGTAVGGLGAWLTYRGWKMTATFSYLSKARHIATAINAIPVKN